MGWQAAIAVVFSVGLAACGRQAPDKQAGARAPAPAAAHVKAPPRLSSAEGPACGAYVWTGRKFVGRPGGQGSAGPLCTLGVSCCLCTAGTFRCITSCSACLATDGCDGCTAWPLGSPGI